MEKSLPKVYNKSSLEVIKWQCYECGAIYSGTIKSEIRKITFKHIDGKCDICRQSLIRHRTNAGYINYKGSRTLEPVEKLVKSSPNTKWICKKHGEFAASIVNAECLIENEKFVCPECRKEKRIVKTVAEYSSHLIKEWDPENDLSPYKVSYGSGAIVKWVCSKCGYKWSREIRARTIGKRGCPECNHKIERFADVYPKLRENFSLKNDFPFEQETKCSDKPALWICNNGHEQIKSFNSVTNGMIHKGRFLCDVCSGIKKKVGFNSLFDIHPELQNQWDYELNEKEGLSPDTIGIMYNVKPLRWKCTRYNHSYSLRLDRKYEYDNAGRESCPYCDGRESYKGFNDLVTTHPELAKEYSANNERSIETIMKTLSLSVLWKCPVCNGEYSYKINLRESGDDSCPYCADKKVLAGFNDLATTYPELAKEYSTNNEKLVTQVKKDMTLVALWNCPICKGEYPYKINLREYEDDSCPYCANKKVLAGFNDLTTTHPELAKEYSANNERPITQVKKDMSLRVLWNCPTCNGEYICSLKTRNLNDDACPFCTNKKVLKGYNSLKAKYPELMEYSDVYANLLVGIDFDIELPSSAKKAYWICSNCKTSYKMRICDRVLKKKRNQNPCNCCNGRVRNKKYIW